MSVLKMMYNDNKIVETLSNELVKVLDQNKEVIVVNIGSDRCIGDSLSPLVGTLLEERRFKIPFYGTCDNPIHALNIHKQLATIKSKHPNAIIIGCDACLGNKENIGEINFRDFSVKPGKGVGKMLPEVGDYSIVGIVDQSEGGELFTNRDIRLSFILNMSQVIAKSLIKAEKIHRKMIEQRKEIAIGW